VIVIVIHPEIVCGAPAAINPTCAGIQSLQTVAARQRGEGLTSVVELRVQFIPKLTLFCARWLPPPPPGPPRPPKFMKGPPPEPKFVNHAKVDGIAAAASGGDVMKVLRRSIQVRQRNKRQQGVGLRADE